MDLLRRYQKPGGFLQLVQLIETCGPQKKHQLLASIEKESLQWANEVKNKILTIDRIFSWNEETLAEVVSRLQELTLSIAVHGIAPEVWEKATKTLGHGQRRRIEDLAKTKSPTSAEISTAFVKIITEIREMISLGYIHLAKIDPGLVIDEDIEERLGKNGPSNSSSSNKASSSSTNLSNGHFRSSGVEPAAITTAPGSPSEVINELARLRKENSELRRDIQNAAAEVQQLRSVISQIKKAVA